MIQSRNVLKKPSAEKQEMLLYALALEIITGAGASFVKADPAVSRSPNAIAAVVGMLSGTGMYDFLEKITYMVLPNQIGFDGLPLSALDKEGHMHLNISSMLNFPDFEEVFDMFEVLKNMNITLVMDNTKGNAASAQLLLSGLSLPIRQKPVKVAS